MCKWLTDLFKRPSSLELSPSDWLEQETISVVNAIVVIDTSKLIPKLSKPPKVWIPSIPGTGSMLPNFSHEHNNILVAGAEPADHAKIIEHLQVGDIAVFRIMSNKEDEPRNFSKPHLWYAIHRIVEIEMDTRGHLFTFKGDNNSTFDPYRARDENILWVSIGTIF